MKDFRVCSPREVTNYDRKKKTIDAVKMVREIRDSHYEETKEMTTEERLAFYREKGREAQEKLRRLAQKKDRRHKPTM